MTQMESKERNQFVDIMRGMAMLLVVLGHTMTGCTVDSQKSLSNPASRTPAVSCQMVVLYSLVRV